MYIIIALVALVFLVITGVVISRLQNVLKNVNNSDAADAEPSGNKWNGAMFIVILILGAVSITWSYLHAREFFYQKHPRSTVVERMICSGFRWVF